jgi:hypothetical protein
LPLDVGYPSQDVVRDENPWIDRISVIPPCPDASCINGDNAVDNLILAPRRNKNDYISWPDGPVLVGNDVETVPIEQEGVHAGADIIDKSLFYWFHWLSYNFNLAGHRKN